MATDNALSAYAATLARLDKATAKVHHAQAQLDKAKEEAAKIVAEALHACLAADGNRTEVQKHSPFSPPTVRAIGDAAGIPPDERYVRSIKDKPES